MRYRQEFESMAAPGLDHAATDVVGLLREQASGFAQKDAYIFLADGECGAGENPARLTYAGLDRRARAIAAKLQALGLAGQRALLLYPPGLEYVEAFFGCLYAGVVAVPAYPPTRQHLPRLMAVVKDAGAALVMTTAALADRFQPGFTAPGLWLETDAVDTDQVGPWTPPVLGPDSLAFLQYTSGSTADPKGVMVSHGNLLANQAAIRHSFRHTEHSTIVGWLPLYHDMGLIGNILQAVYAGTTAILMPPMAFLEKPVRWLHAISHYRAVTSGGPNFAYDLCVNRITPEQKRGLDLGSWALAFNGSETVQASTLERFASAFADCGFRRESFFPCYGLAEATLFVTGPRRNGESQICQLDGQRIAGLEAASVVACGMAWTDHETLIVHPETRKVCAEREIGEIWVAGPSVAQGYWNRPEESEQTFRAQPEPATGRHYLRTGDLGFKDDGQLHVAGRIKDLIIIRGRNHHPQDIEHALTTGIAALRPGCCAAFALDRDGQECLAVVAELNREALRGKDHGPVFAAMRQILAEDCGIAGAELALVKPGVLAKTSSGKLRRHACKQAYLDGTMEVLARDGVASEAVAAPEVGGEEAGLHDLLREALPALPVARRVPLLARFLRGRLARLLKTGEAELPLDLPLRSAGLDSLKAVELKYAVDSLLGGEAPLSWFLSDQTLDGLAAALAENLGQPAPAIPAADPTGLSQAQKAMWTVHQLDADSRAYNLHLALRLDGGLEPGLLRQALDRLIGRHGQLRTAYRLFNGVPRQETLAEAADYFVEFDAENWPQARFEDRLGQIVRQVFDLEQGPLLRVALFRHGAASHTVLLCAHHIAVDLWSLLVFLDGLGAVYASLAAGRQASLPKPQAEYRDAIAWQQTYLDGPAAETAWAYWQRQLAGGLPTLALPLDYPRPKTPDQLGGSVALRLDAVETARLQALARRQGVTLFTLLLAAYKVFLHRHTHQDDIIVGVPASGRTHSRFAQVVGNFVNPLPLRSHPHAGLGFADYLEQVHAVQLAGMEHQDFPFGLIVERLQTGRADDQWPVFQTLFVLQQAQASANDGFTALALGEDGGPWAFGGWQARSIAVRQRVADFDLKLMAALDGAELLFSFQYRADLFEPDTIRRWSRSFRSLLIGIADDPHTRLGSLPVLDEADSRLLRAWNATQVEYPTGHVLQLFESWAEQTPDAIALVCGEDRLDYRELNVRCNRLAHGLIRQGVRPDTPVAVCARRSVEMVLGLVGVMKAGCAYLPLDPDYPEERLKTMLEDADAGLILVQSGLEAGVADLGREVWVLDAELSGFADCPAHDPKLPIGGASLAYVLFTSGSTGRPKGVAVPHQGLWNRLLWMRGHFAIDKADVILQKTPYTFDVSVWEFFLPLVCGARLVMAGPDEHKEPQRLIGQIETHGVTTVHFVPSMLNVFLDAQGLDRCASLRRVVCSGEALGAELLPRFFGRLGAELHNLYGPTEASIDVTAWACGKDETSVPIGRPIANTQIHLLDANLEPVPIGVAGELHIGGVQLARGYVNRPDLSAERFIPDPFGGSGGRLYKTGDLARHRPDGAIEYLGRIDHQVKIRGFRIELGEIEARLKQHPAVQDAVAVAREDSPGDKRLVAYWTGAAEAEALRVFLKEALPDYMLPVAFVQLDRLPLSQNGKLDRKALPAPDLELQFAGQYAAPRTSAESVLAEIWASLLRVNRVGIHDNFFALGGDSILAIQVASRASQAGLALTPRQIFQQQTVAELAAVAGIAESPAESQEAVSGPVPLTPIQQWFFGQNLAKPQHWNQAVWLEARQSIDVAALEQAVAHWLIQHDALRMRFRQEGGVWKQTGLAAVPQAVFHAVDLSQETDLPARFQAECRHWQASLDLGEGPLLRVVWLGAESGGRLLILIHHLVVDGVSWRILLEDLQTAYRQLTSGQTPKLPVKTLSFQAWAERVQALADPQALREETAYWQDALADIPALPVDFPQGTRHESGIALFKVELGEAQTHALLREVHSAYRTGINDLLLAALAQTLCAWSGHAAVLVDMEGHGRDLLDDADVSRTVAWFTRLYPQALRLPQDATRGGLIKSVKAQLRRTPRQGTGYGALPYLGKTQVLFNYLGQTDQDGEGAPFALLQEPADFCRAPENDAAYALEIIAWVSGQRLRLEWRYASEAYREATVAALAEDHLTALCGLIEHCLSPQAGGFSPADFPLLAASAEELSALPYDPRDIEDIYPLSPMQEGMLFDTLMAPHSGIYLMQDRFELRGAVDVEIFQRAWQQLVDRQPALRASFDWASFQRPCQIIHARVELPFEFFDWRGLAQDEQQARLDSLLEAERARGFDLSKPPLMAVRLIRLGEDRHCFVRSYHHILVDAWCLSLILTELKSNYEALLQGQTLDLPEAPRFADYIAWLQGRDETAARDFWQGHLQGLAEPTPLVVDRPGAAGGSVGDAIAFLSAQDTAALTALAQQHRLTANTFIQAAWALLLSRYSGRGEVVFGVTVAGRPADLAGSEQMLGVFINSLPLRVRVSPDQSLLDFLHGLLRQNLEIRQFEHTPLVQIQAWSGLPRELPLFESLLVFENYPVDPSLRSGEGALNLTGVETRTHSNYPLNGMVIPGERLHLQITYHKSRFEDDAVERMLGHFKQLLEAMIADPGRRLGGFPMLTGAEQTQLVDAWNRTGHAYPEPCDIVGQFESWAERTPDATAVSCRGESLTYRQVQARTDRLAHALAEAGIGPDDVVALLDDRGLVFLLMMLGVFKAGAAYLPLDPTQPDGRLAQVLEESRVGLLLAGAGYWDRAQGILSAIAHPPKLFEPVALAQAALTDGGIMRRHGPANLAFIIFTSGSTGTPKGAMVEHQGMYNNLITKLPTLGLTSADVIAQTAGQCFDISVWQHLTPLVIGGRVAIFPDEVAKDPGLLLEQLERCGVTVLETVPSMIQALLDFAEGTALPRLRWLLACGEAFPPALCRRWMERFPHTQVLNAYGPAECSDDVSYYAVPAKPGEADTVVPVGRPVDNTRLHLLDPWLDPVPVGVPGEICVAGIQVGRGYLHRPELTAAVFVPDPFGAPGERLYRTGDLGRYRPDGVIEFLGRIDHQLKIRGFRVEPAEIEAQILRHPGVGQVCVLAREDGRGALRLVAYVAHGGKPDADPHVLSDRLREFLGERLPGYMVPAAFVWLDSLPVGANGKTDRKALPELDIAAETEDRYLAPRTPAEEILVRIWEEVLGVRRVGVRDTFFELGGHSLLAVQVLSRLRAAFGVELSLRSLFEAATIEELANRVEQALIEQLEALSEEDALALLDDGP